MAIYSAKKIPGFLFSPVAAFRSSKKTSITRAFLYFASLLLFHATASLLLVMALMHGIQIGGRGVAGAAWMGLSGTFFGPILSGLGVLALGGLVLHAGVVLLGGRRGLIPTYKAALYAATPWLLFGWIPLIGPIPLVWTLVDLAIGIRELHGISTVRSAGAVLFAVIVGFVLLLISLSRVV